MSGTATFDIVPAVPADGAAVGGALARAFQEDPVLSWVVPAVDARRERLPSVFAAFADLYLPGGVTYLAGRGAGAVLAAAAGHDPLEERLEELGERLSAALGDDVERALELDALLRESHPAEPSVYLHFMGVVPEHQGHGLGGRMLTTVLRDCDAAGAPAYLEATSPANRRLYERHGFEAVGEVAPPGGPPLWPMWREASAPPA